MLDDQLVVGVALDGLDDAVAVEWTEQQGAKHEQVEGALEQLDAVGAGA